MSVCLSVCLAQVCLEQSILVFLGQRSIRALREHSESIIIIVIQSEPKILRLVLVHSEPKTLFFKIFQIFDVFMRNQENSKSI